MICKKCGSKIKEGEQFCRKCGAPINSKIESVKRKQIDAQLNAEFQKTSLDYYNAKCKGYLDQLIDKYKIAENCIIKVNEELVQSGAKPFPKDENNHLYPYEISISRFAAKVLQKSKGISHKKVFATIEEANNWLSSSQGIKSVKVEYELGTKIGAFANHSICNKVTINFLQTNFKYDYIYQLQRIDKTHGFIAGSNDYINEVAKRNPKKKIIDCKVSTHQRGDPAALAIGVGVMEHKTFYVTYQQSRDDSKGLV